MVVCMFERLMQKDNFYATVQSKKKKKGEENTKEKQYFKR